MHPTDTPIFAIPCIGAVIAQVQVFATYIRYEQKLGRDITLTAHMIASVEMREHEHGYVILSTTTRRKIICMVQRKYAAGLDRAIRRVHRNHLGVAAAQKV
jgi:hypothetical protein